MPTADSQNGSPKPSRLRRLWRVLVLGVSSLLIVGAAVALVIIYQPMHERAEQILSGPVTIKFYWPVMEKPDGAPDRTKTWLDEASRAELEGLARAALSDRPFDHDALERTQEAVMATGWFAEPVKVQREEGGVVSIFGPWRIPTAVVRWNGKDYLVAEKSERLIREYEPGTSGLKVITGTQFDPPAFGSPWLGGDVEAGLKLMTYIRQSTAWPQVAAIDVSTYTQNKQLVIVTDRGNRVLWGGPPDEFMPGQAPPDYRRRRLEKLLADSGRIDAALPLVDIRLMENVYDVISPQDEPPVEEPAKPKKK